MYKKICLILFMINSFASSVTASASHRESKPCTPENTIMLWDIHNVIVTRSKWDAIKAFVNYPKPWDLIKKIRISLLRALCQALWNKSLGSAGRMMDLAHQHNNKELADLIETIANLQTPIAGTVDIIRELRANGYENNIGSNIDAEIFLKLQKKLPNVFNSELFELSKSQTIIYTPDGEISKPNPAFFIAYLRKNNIDLATKQIIFVDDLKKNVEAARQLGMIGIQFINPQQLRERLIELGIEIPVTGQYPDTATI